MPATVGIISVSSSRLIGSNLEEAYSSNVWCTLQLASSTFFLESSFFPASSSIYLDPSIDAGRRKRDLACNANLDVSVPLFRELSCLWLAPDEAEPSRAGRNRSCLLRLPVVVEKRELSAMLNICRFNSFHLFGGIKR